MRRTHQDLLAWQLAMQLVKDVYARTSRFPQHEQYGLTAQIRRAAVSIPSNIAEGAARNTRREFRHFLGISRGSLSELDTQLLIARSLGYAEDMQGIDETLERVFALLGGLINSLGESDEG